MDGNNSTDNTDANASLHARKETGRSMSRRRQKDGVLPPGQTHLPSAWTEKGCDNSMQPAAARPLLTTHDARAARTCKATVP
ncbi:hypothetical protein BaRGS_00008471 [Batillaria attramentaria]|uniref:Uncharacterized protein n=1 Tax=Batillaria attramentaria TaxID=370345 RepID=A0ABD0LM32_9CAEN